MSSMALSMVLALATTLTMRGARRRSRLALAVGLALATTALVVFGVFSVWGAMLWFEEAAFVEHFWTVAGATVGVALTAALAAALLVAILTARSGLRGDRARRIGIAVAALAGAAWGAASWTLVLRWVAGEPSRTREPILGREIGFHVLALPLADALFSLLLLVLVISGLVTAWSTRGGARPTDVHLEPKRRRRLVRPGGSAPVAPGVLALLLAGSR